MDRHERSNVSSVSNLNLAIQQFKSGVLNYDEAANKYNIPLSILLTKVIASSSSRNHDKEFIRRTHIKEDIHRVEEFPASSKKPPVCAFCYFPGYREEELGELHFLKNISAHYYCLLFSSGLWQHGNDDEGVLGFLHKDIIKECRRGSKLKCRYCSKNGATVGCNNKKCKMTYHFPCGLDKFAQFEFDDEFRSFCFSHRKFQKGKNIMEEVECPICFENLKADPKKAVWSTCCRPMTWFHKLCLKKLALSEGSLFKCPLCNDEKTFVKEMKCEGIYVPERDAIWEGPNAFPELEPIDKRCDAQVCTCGFGRKTNREDGRFQILMCHACGSTGVHLECADLPSESTEWTCQDCTKCFEKREVTSIKDSPSKKRSLEDSEDESSTKRRRVSSSSNIPMIPTSSTPSLIIKDLVDNHHRLNDEAKKMKNYVQKFHFKLKALKMNENSFLDKLVKFRSDFKYISANHINRFINLNFNMDQMNTMKTLIESYFSVRTAQNLRKKMVYKKRAGGERGDSLLRDCCTKRERCVTLLKYIQSNLLLEGHNTLPTSAPLKTVDTASTSAVQDVDNSVSEDNISACCFDNMDSRISPSSTDVSVASDVNKCDTLVRCERTIEMEIQDIGLLLQDTCHWCERKLNLECDPMTINMSSLVIKILCSSCKTLHKITNFKEYISHRSVSTEVNEITIENEHSSIDDDDDDEVYIQYEKDIHTEVVKDEPLLFSPLNSPSDEEINVDLAIVKTETECVSSKVSHMKSESSDFFGFETNPNYNSFIRSKSLSDNIATNVLKYDLAMYDSSSDIDLYDTDNDMIVESQSIDYSESNENDGSEHDEINHDMKMNVLSSDFINKIGARIKMSEPKINSTIDTNAAETKSAPLNCPSQDTCSNDSDHSNIPKVNQSEETNRNQLNEPSPAANSSKEVSNKTVKIKTDLPNKDSVPDKSSGKCPNISEVKFKDPDAMRFIDMFLENAKSSELCKPASEKLQQLNEIYLSTNTINDNETIEPLLYEDPFSILPIATDANNSEVKFMKPVQATIDKCIKIDNKNVVTPHVASSSSHISKTVNVSITKTTSDLVKDKSTSKINVPAIENKLKHLMSNFVSGKIKLTEKPLSHSAAFEDSFERNRQVTAINCDGCRFDAKSVTTFAPERHIKCYDCYGIPQFCNLTHFDLWHENTHHWVAVKNPPNRPCKICAPTTTSYHCPACSSSVGFCSAEHYNVIHQNIPPVLSPKIIKLEPGLENSQKSLREFRFCNTKVAESAAENSIRNFRK